VSGLASSLALALVGLSLALPAARARGIRRRRQVRVTRVAPNELEQLCDLLRQRSDLGLELSDPRVPRRQLGVLPRKRALQLGDSLVAPVRSHQPPIADPRPNGKHEKKDGTIWTTYAGPERLQTGKHRRVRMEDLLRFKATRAEERKATLDELTALSEDYGGYGDELK
jgi:hypothetical protein